MKYVRIVGDVAYVELTRGMEAVIDVADVPLVSRYSWHVVPVSGRIYARSQRAGYMHRLILQPPGVFDVDHRNHNGLDNRRENLRICSRGQNMLNRRGANANSTTGVRGVYVHRLKKVRKRATSKTEVVTYNARYMVNGKSHTKNFPYTPEGLKAATEWVEARLSELDCREE